MLFMDFSTSSLLTHDTMGNSQSHQCFQPHVLVVVTPIVSDDSINPSVTSFQMQTGCEHDLKCKTSAKNGWLSNAGVSQPREWANWLVFNQKQLTTSPKLSKTIYNNDKNEISSLQFICCQLHICSEQTTAASALVAINKYAYEKPVWEMTKWLHHVHMPKMPSSMGSRAKMPSCEKNHAAHAIFGNILL